MLDSYKSRKIRCLANIFPGQSIRGRVNHQPRGKYLIAQMRDVSPYKGLDKATLSRMNLKEGVTPKLVKKGDLLFISKSGLGATPFSIIVKEDIKNLIASPLFYIIRVKASEAYPEYLNWYINSSSQSQRFLKKNAMGSVVLSVPKRVFSEMEIILPPLSIQKKWVQWTRLAHKEYEVMGQIYKKRKQLMDAIITSAKQGNQI